MIIFGIFHRKWTWDKKAKTSKISVCWCQVSGRPPHTHDFFGRLDGAAALQVIAVQVVDGAIKIGPNRAPRETLWTRLGREIGAPGLPRSPLRSHTGSRRGLDGRAAGGHCPENDFRVRWNRQPLVHGRSGTRLLLPVDRNVLSWNQHRLGRGREWSKSSSYRRHSATTSTTKQ